jgi:hypothetical protein
MIWNLRLSFILNRSRAIQHLYGPMHATVLVMCILHAMMRAILPVIPHAILPAILPVTLPAIPRA